MIERCSVILLAVILLGGMPASPSAGPSTANALPRAIASVMHKPRYRDATWRMLVTDLKTGKTVYAWRPMTPAFTVAGTVSTVAPANRPALRFPTTG